MAGQWGPLLLFLDSEDPERFFFLILSPCMQPEDSDKRRFGVWSKTKKKNGATDSSSQGEQRERRLAPSTGKHMRRLFLTGRGAGHVRMGSEGTSESL